MRIKERQIWRTLNRQRVSIYQERGDGTFVVGPSGVDPDFAKQYIGTYLVDSNGVRVHPSGDELNYDQLGFSLGDYKGYEIDLSDREGIQAFGCWINDCLRSLTPLCQDDAHQAIDRIRSKVKEICEGYPNGLPLERR